MRLILYSEQKDRLHVFVMWTLIQLRVKPNNEISRLVYNSNTSITNCQSIKVDFAKLLTGSDKHDLSFVLIKFQFVSLYPRPYGAHTLFHGMYCLCFTKRIVWVEGKIKLSVISGWVCVGQVQLDDLEQLAGIGTEE